MRMAIRAAIPIRIPTSRPDKMPRLASRSRTLPCGLLGVACCAILSLLSYDRIDVTDHIFPDWRSRWATPATLKTMSDCMFQLLYARQGTSWPVLAEGQRRVVAADPG